MTSVPKPLKFLKAHFLSLKGCYEAMADGENKRFLADVISVLAMAYHTDHLESLRYRLVGSKDGMESWGHEYVRNLSGEIGIAYQERMTKEEPVDDLLELVDQIVPYHFHHNAEHEAVDLLLEVERLSKIVPHIDEGNYQRTCLYLLGCASYLQEPEDKLTLQVAYDGYLKVRKLPDAMRVALKLNNMDLIVKTFNLASSLNERKQLAYMMSRQNVLLDLEDGPAAIDDDSEREIITEILGNARINEQFLMVARDLDVMEAKTPEDIYKSHLIEGRVPTSTTVSSARQNLASSFVNAFVNAGFGHDKLLTDTSEGDGTVNWIFKNRERGKMSAAASLGMIMMWDVAGGLPQIDKYLYSTDSHVVAGALLAVGIINTNVHDECDPAFALLSDSVNKDGSSIRIGAIMGLGLAYAGTCKEDVQELLLPLLGDEQTPMEVAGFAAVSIGLVFLGSAQEECCESILQALMMRPEHQLKDPFAHYMVLGLGLLFLGKGDAVDATIEVSKALNTEIAHYCELMLDVCAYATTGNVLKVQAFLSKCTEVTENEELSEGKKGLPFSIAVLGIAAVAMGEELGSEMVHRSLEHLLQYGEAPIRKAVPLALALLNVSSPTILATDVLSRLSHDADLEVAQNAVLALGLVAAGTNNARVAGTLRQLSSYYYKEPDVLFLVRIAQGLVHLGKGLITLTPEHSDRGLLSLESLAGIFCVLFSCLDMKSSILGKHAYILYFLTVAMRANILVTVDEEGKALPVPVRVGKAVDVVGQAGRPKTITGFQTHTTPVLLNVGERAELATSKYLPMTTVLEGVVILKENPDYVEGD